MKKLITTFILALALFVPATTHALEANQSVWFTSVPTVSGEELAAKIGDPILIYANLKNTTKDPITYTLSFVANEKVIGTKTTTVPGYTEQAASIEWKMPQTSTVVTASITKALDKNKKEIATLKATIGTVTVAPVLEMPKVAVKGFVGKGLNYIENFRLKNLAYFTALKAKVRQELGGVTIDQVSSLIRTETTVAPGQTAPATQVEDRNTTRYVVFIYATAGESFFAHKALFYIVSILLAFFVIRFIIRRFV